MANFVCGRACEDYLVSCLDGWHGPPYRRLAARSGRPPRMGRGIARLDRRAVNSTMVLACPCDPINNFVVAISEHASWGYFDYRMKGEGFEKGYQSVPVNWGISSARKRGFFRLLGEISGAYSGRDDD